MMKSSKKLIFGGLIGVIVLLVVLGIYLFSLYYSFMDDISEIGYVSFKSEKVDTIYSVIGKKDVCSYSSKLNTNNERYEIDYCEDALVNKDYIKYSVYLLGEGFVLTQDNIGNEWYVKESSDDNKIIGVFIDDLDGKIIYQKISGNLYEDTIDDNYL